MGTEVNTVSILYILIATYAIPEYFINRIVSGGLPDRTSIRSALRLGIIQLILSILLILPFITAGLLFYLVVVIVLNRIFDILLFNHRRIGKSLLERYLFKQILIIGMIYTGWIYFTPFELHQWYSNIIQAVSQTPDPLIQWIFVHHAHIFITVTGAVFVIDAGTHIVRGILAKFPRLSEAAIASLQSGTYQYTEENSGEWIGILERILAFIFMILQAYMAIAFVLTAKSIARFRELENKPFAEYYLIGTTASVLVAIITGLFIRAIYSIL